MWLGLRASKPAKSSDRETINLFINRLLLDNKIKGAPFEVYILQSERSKIKKKLNSILRTLISNKIWTEAARRQLGELAILPDPNLVSHFCAAIGFSTILCKARRQTKPHHEVPNHTGGTWYPVARGGVSSQCFRRCRSFRRWPTFTVCSDSGRSTNRASVFRHQCWRCSRTERKQV